VFHLNIEKTTKKVAPHGTTFLILAFRQKLLAAFKADEVHDLQAGEAKLLCHDFLEVVLDRELLRVLFSHEEFLIFEHDFLEDLRDTAIDLALHEFRLGNLAGFLGGVLDLGLGDFLFLFDGFSRDSRMGRQREKGGISFRKIPSVRRRTPSESRPRTK